MNIILSGVRFRLFSLLLVLGMCSSPVFSQHLEIFVHSGYSFADKFPIDGGRGKMEAGHTYGGSLGYQLGEEYIIEVSYMRQDADVKAYSTYFSLDVNEPVNVSYIFAGGNRLFPIDEKFNLFTGARLGAFLLNFKDSSYDNITRFAVGVNAGLKYLITPQLGIRAQANLNFPITDVGANLWWSPGSGVDVGVESYTPLLQFGFTGGLVFVIK